MTKRLHPAQLKRPRRAMSPEEFMSHALDTPGGFALPFQSKHLAVSLRNACSMVKSRDKQKRTREALSPRRNEDDVAEALLNYIPNSQYDGLHFCIEFRKGYYWLIGERSLDCPAEGMPLNELRAMEKGDVENPSPAQQALQQLRENVVEMEKAHEEE